MSDNILRRNLVDLLKGGQAHVAIEQALNGIDSALINTRPDGFEHSIWEVLEHMRIAQEDILRYTLVPDWQSPKFPEGIWPDAAAIATADDWSKSVAKFLAELNEVIELAQNNNIELTAAIPHAAEHTYLREVLLVADHNAYHIAEIVRLRKFLKNW